MAKKKHPESRPTLTFIPREEELILAGTLKLKTPPWENGGGFKILWRSPYDYAS